MSTRYCHTCGEPTEQSLLYTLTVRLWKCAYWLCSRCGCERRVQGGNHA